MDKEMLVKIEKYLQDHYIDPSLIFSQLPSRCETKAGESIESSSSEPSNENHLVELNLPQLEVPFAAQLLKLIRTQGKTEAEVYKKARLDRRLFSKIRTNKNYSPSKATVLALIIALELSEVEAKDLLERAGYGFSRSQKGDVIIRFFIRNRIYDFFIISEVLAYYGIKMPWSVYMHI